MKHDEVCRTKLNVGLQRGEIIICMDYKLILEAPAPDCLAQELGSYLWRVMNARIRSAASTHSASGATSAKRTRPAPGLTPSTSRER